MSAVDRRKFLNYSTAAVAGSMLVGKTAAAAESPRKFTMDFVGGRIGVQAQLPAVIELAANNGFESIGPPSGQIAKLSDDELDALVAILNEKKLVWGAADLPVNFRAGEEQFKAGLAALPALGAALKQAGVTRVGTWLRPAHQELTYVANFRQHARRLKEIATVLDDNGLRFGLEYVGPFTSWTRERYPFIHTMAETRDLLAAIGRDNVGFVLDSWHWYTAEETKDDLLSLQGTDVIACDLNDAPTGLAVREQQDLSRELPATTGVIDLKAFLTALVEIGYDGPVRAEPFNKSLNALPDDEAAAKTAAAMRKAFALIG